MPGSMFVGRFSRAVSLCPCLLLAALPAAAQVFIVQPEHIETHYTHFTPTDIKLPTEPLNVAGREQLIRFLQAEEGFAMRPLPIANLTLRANGGMEPTGEKYVDELHTKGIAAHPGDRVVVTDIRIRPDSIVLDLNNGPEHKHRFLRHIQIGMGDGMTAPVVADDGNQPTGSRITLLFSSRLPDLSGQQVEALLKPMIDFGVKSPAEAYAESLPDFLHKAIDEHRVLIGMDRDMVLYAKGEPIRKVREQDATGKQFEIWIYGEAPQPVEFVRFVGNFVVRDELAKVGEPIAVRTGNEMGDFWGNQPTVAAANQHTVEEGDPTAADRAEENAPRTAPTLRLPGDKTPTDASGNPTGLAPVNFPPDARRPGDPGYTPPPASTSPGSTQTGSTQTTTAQQPASGSPASAPSKPATASTQPSSSGSTPPAAQPQPTTSGTTPQPQPNPNQFRGQPSA